MDEKPKRRRALPKDVRSSRIIISMVVFGMTHMLMIALGYNIATLIPVSLAIVAATVQMWK